jgi:aspartate-semialdehyde dehydrogenase
LGASNLGHRGVDELEKQTAGLLTGREPDETPFPHRLAFNLFPQVGEFSGDWTTEELSLRAESARVWGPTPPVEGTAVQVPTFYGCSLLVTLELARPSSADELRAAFASAKRVKVLDTPAEKIYPMPMLVTADPTVHVGRVRVLATSPSRATFFLAVDNAGRRGAALNAVEIAARLAAKRS